MSRPEHSERSFENKEHILKSEKSGCYFCIRVYASRLVVEYCKDKNGFTAICPKCGIDSVIPFDKEVDKDEESFKKYLDECEKISFGLRKRN